MPLTTGPDNSNDSELDTLEQLVDRLSLPTVIHMLGIIASTKAEHINDNWQDKGLADLWDEAASVCFGASDKTKELR